MPLRPCTDKEWSALLHIMSTSDIDQDPNCHYCGGKLDNEEWFDAQYSFPDGPDSKLFNEYGEHRNMSNYCELHFFDTETFKEDTLDDVISSFLSRNNVNTKRKEPVKGSLQPLFNCLPINLIKNNF